MCKLLHFPSQGHVDPPEPPVSSMRMPRPVEPVLINAVSHHVLFMPTTDRRTPFSKKPRIVA